MIRKGIEIMRRQKQVEPDARIRPEDMPLTEILAGLAEECTELAQAALKLRRAHDKTNPTPATQEECLKWLHEEIADVALYLSFLKIDLQLVSDTMYQKKTRWIERLNKGESTDADRKPG